MDDMGQLAKKPRLQLRISGVGDSSEGFAVQEGEADYRVHGARNVQGLAFCPSPGPPDTLPIWPDTGTRIRPLEFSILPQGTPDSTFLITSSKVVAYFSRRYGISSLSPKSQDSPSRKKQKNEGAEHLFDSIPEPIVQQILMRLSICDLLRAQLTCVAWRSMVFSCRFFRALYDEGNGEKWIALSRHRQNPDGFALFNLEGHQWSFLCLTEGWISPNMTWFLEAASDGLMLFVSREGNLVVANPLTRNFRRLPDAKLSSRLWLESRLKKLKGFSRSHGRPIMEIIVDPASGSFRVVILGEFRKKVIHVMVYSSDTDSWNVNINREIDTKLLRRLTQSTLQGSTVYGITTERRFNLVSYEMESNSFLAQEISRLEYPRLTWSGEEVQPIRVVPYGKRMMLLGTVSGHLISGPSWKPFTVMAVWESKRRPDEWSLLSFTPIEWVQKIFRSTFAPRDVAAACDGGNTVWVIFREGWKMISLNLDTKEWKACLGYAEEMNSAGNSRRPQEQRKAFSMRLKLSAVV